MKKVYTLFTMCLLVVGGIFAQLPNGSVAPDWTLTDINGNDHQLYEYLDNGYTVILDFSATWCPPCWAYHNSGALEELYINHGPVGMPNVSEDTTNDVMVFFIEGDGSTNSDDLNGTGNNTMGDWVTNTPYPIIDDDAITSLYAINAWPTIYTVCPNREINVSGQISTDEHYELAYACAVASLDYQVNTTSPTIQDGLAENVFTFDLVNSGENTTEQLLFTLTTDAPADWNASFAIDGTVAEADLLEVTSVGGLVNAINLNVQPGDTPALANYGVEVTSLDNPNAPTLVASFFVAHGITDIVVDHGGVATQWNDDFLEGLNLAGNTTYGLLDSEKFIEAIAEGQLSEVGHIYYNMAWNFPSLTNELVFALSDFLNGGGNMYIAGQDLAWDTWNNEGTSVTQEFFTDYMRATFVDDGSGANNMMNWNDDNIAYVDIASSSIVDVYNGNIYPDEFDPIDPAVAIMHYGSNVDKTGGIRLEENGHKIIYLGIDQGMIADEAIRKEVITVAHNWFHGLVSIEEFDAAYGKLFGDMYPNPATNYTIIPMEDLEEDVTIQLMDVQGKVVFDDVISQGSTQYTLDVTTLDAGMYQYVITNAKGQSTSKSLEVVK